MDTIEEAAMDIVSECSFRKRYFKDLTDHDPLVMVMYNIADRIENRFETLENQYTRKIWKKSMVLAQYDNSAILEQNHFIPCRFCNQAFEPLIGELLLDLFLKWYKSLSTKDLLSIHRCPACKGQIKAKRAQEYKGDYHTPAPGSIEDDDVWAETLLQYSTL